MNSVAIEYIEKKWHSSKFKFFVGFSEPVENDSPPSKEIQELQERLRTSLRLPVSGRY